MDRVAVFLLFLPLAFAAPTSTVKASSKPTTSTSSSTKLPSASSSAQNIQVIWKHHKHSASKAVYALTEDETKLLGQSCSDKLTSGRFSNETITFDVDDNGFGDITVGSTKYKVHSDPKHSGGITCNKIYNEEYAGVDCIVPFSGSNADPAPLSSAGNCFLGLGASHRASAIHPPEAHRRINSKSGNSTGHVHPEIKKTANLTERFVGPNCPPLSDTQLVGDGDPHQNFFDEQISENNDCGPSPTCSTGYTDTTSLTVGFSVGSGSAVTAWISGGFSVSKAWTSGNNYVCGAKTGETVCTWYNTAHTAYTVVNRLKDGCGPIQISDPFVLFSPNTDNVGGGYYCVIGTCENKNANHWDYSGRPGGP